MGFSKTSFNSFRKPHFQPNFSYETIHQKTANIKNKNSTDILLHFLFHSGDGFGDILGVFADA
ncbi:MAG: hypothetical protein LBF88_10875, partial [Planctomycetaceae bacterium]|nr:hypothetical protein [Planctomycetaceae bacterium]